MKPIITLLLVILFANLIFSYFQSRELERLRNASKDQRIYSITQVDSIVSMQNTIIQNKEAQLYFKK